MVTPRRRIVLASGLAIVALAALVLMATVGVVPAEVVATLVFFGALAALMVGLFKLSSGPAAHLIARWRIGIRWKIGIALAAIGSLVFFSTVVNFQAMDYMHQELHEIQELGAARSGLVLAAVNELERTQHGPFFELTPLIAFAGALAVLCLGIAIAQSVIEAMRNMERGLERIGSGDFSRPIVVANRDEFGRLAEQINHSASDLAKAQATILATERRRAFRQRIAEVTVAQEEERRRISRELHDDLGPSLAATVNRLRAARALVRTEPARVEVELGEIAEGLSGHIREIRELINDLRPLALDQLGLVGALRQHVERFGTEQAVQVSFSSSGRFRLRPTLEMTVFRVAQEALSNVQRHAGARHAEVRLRSDGSLVELIVEDDGRGFDSGAIAVGGAGQGVGLLSMQERAELAGGRVLVASTPGRGCRVTLQVPLEEVTVGAHPNAAR